MTEAQTADTIFTNGKVYTANPDQEWAEAVAISGNKIVYVGDDGGAEAYRGAGAERFDLDGMMVLPGFVSGHDHLIASNWTKAGVNLFGSTSKAEYLERIKRHADTHPDEGFVFGYGWDRQSYGGLPTAKDLDSVVADRPAMIFDFTVHDLWFNTKALEAGNVTKDTPDPQPGFSYWSRDNAGNPDGVGIELCWSDAFIAAGAWQREELITASQRSLYQTAAAQGFTAVINQGLATPNLTNLAASLDDHEYAFEMLDELDREGRLQLRTFQQVLYKDAEGSVDQLVGAALEMRRRFDSDRLRVSGVKIHPEGNWNSHTSLMLEPFSDTPGDCGKAGVSPERVREIVLAANAAGLDVSVHVDGTATTRTTIDAFEEAIKKGYSDARNSLQHYHNAHPVDQQRVIDLGLTVNTTPLFGTDWSNSDDQARKILGEERIQTTYMPYIGAFEAGLKVSLSADVPSSPQDEASALLNIEAAVTQRDPGNPNSKVFPPGREGLPLEQAIQGVTIFPAWQARMENKIGTLEVGKYADLVVLEDNLFEVEPRDIADVRVRATMMDGSFTHRDGI